MVCPPYGKRRTDARRGNRRRDIVEVLEGLGVRNHCGEVDDAGMRASLKDCSEEEKVVGCQAIAVHFNTAAAAEGHTARSRLRKGCGGMTQTQGVQRRATAAGGSG